MHKGSVHFCILCAVPNNRASVFPFFRLRISSFLLDQAESSAMAFDNFQFSWHDVFAWHDIFKASVMLGYCGCRGSDSNDVRKYMQLMKRKIS